ncbi:MAG: NTP transferase domain-containing protein, partial [Rhodobacteraceae bacterium]|nr:NTP transferase domain-containing protein [Paracoccaceae bacterium]
MTTAIIVLAAGQGTRMASDRPKVLHQIAHAPLLHHVMRAAAALNPARTVIVIGNGAESVADSARALDPRAETALQTERLGTAHAVAQARPALAGFEGDAVVLYGDTPFVRPETLQAMRNARSDGAAVVVLGFEAADPTGYGRLITGADGALEAIVEHKDASDAQRSITLCNSGVACADAPTLFSLVAAVGHDNANGASYLPDIVAIATARALSCPTLT